MSYTLESKPDTPYQQKVIDKAVKLIESGQVKKYPNNDVYEKMKSFCEGADFIYWFCHFTVEDITTIVDCGGKVEVYKSEKCCITLQSGSHIHFSSKGKDIDISRVISNEKGDGKLLLIMVLLAYQNVMDQNPTSKSDLILECIGSVGMGVNHRQMDVKDQASVFRSFGFRKYGKYDPKHIHMKLDRTTSDFNNRIKQVY